MQFVPSKTVEFLCRIAVVLFFLLISFATAPFCLAGDKEDLAGSNAFLAIVESGAVDDFNRAEKLFDAIPLESKLKAVAAHSMALIYIRDQKFSEAWKILGTPSKEQDSDSNTIKFGRKKLKTDPKTQERKRVPPSERDKRQYQQQLENYNAWPARATKYQQDTAQFPGRVKQWEQRLTEIQTQLKTAEDAIAGTKGSMKEMQDGITQGVSKELKETGDLLEKLERSAAISNVAYKNVTAKEPKGKPLNGPSNFQLLDYSSECARLKKSVARLSEP